MHVTAFRIVDVRVLCMVEDLERISIPIGLWYWCNSFFHARCRCGYANLCIKRLGMAETLIW